MIVIDGLEGMIKSPYLNQAEVVNDMIREANNYQYPKFPLYQIMNLDPIHFEYFDQISEETDYFRQIGQVLELPVHAIDSNITINTSQHDDDRLIKMRGCSRFYDIEVTSANAFNACILFLLIVRKQELLGLEYDLKNYDQIKLVTN